MAKRSKRKRALIATRIHLPEPSAASFRWQAVEKALIAEGFQVEVLTSTYPSGTKDSPQPPPSAKVSRWPVLRDNQGNLRGYLQYLSFDIPLFFRLLVARRADIVMVEPPPTTGFMVRIVCALRGMPYVWYAADTWTHGAKSAGAPALIVELLRLVESFVIRGAAVTFVVTEGIERRVREMGGKRIAFIPNGIDTEFYTQYPRTDAPQTAKQFGLSGPYFIYAGTASEFQGATIFLQAFERMLGGQPDLQILFVGSGSDWPKLAALAAEINERQGRSAAVVAGRQDPGVVAALLSSAVASLVSIASTHSGDTPYPTKVFASLSSGTKVIYVGEGPAAADLERESMGWVTSFRVESVAEAMGNALKEYPLSSNERDRLHDWTRRNRSAVRVGRMAVGAVLRVLAKQGEIS